MCQQLQDLHHELPQAFPPYFLLQLYLIAAKQTAVTFNKWCHKTSKLGCYFAKCFASKTGHCLFSPVQDFFIIVKVKAEVYCCHRYVILCGSDQVASRFLPHLLFLLFVTPTPVTSLIPETGHLQHVQQDLCIVSPQRWFRQVPRVINMLVVLSDSNLIFPASVAIGKGFTQTIITSTAFQTG